MYPYAQWPHLSYAYDRANWFWSGPAEREDNQQVQNLMFTLPACLSGAGAVEHVVAVDSAGSYHNTGALDLKSPGGFQS